MKTTNNAIQIRKVRKADNGFVDRGAAEYTPAQYGIFKDGEQVGVIVSSPRRYMDPTEWRLQRLGEMTEAGFRRAGVGRGYARTLKEAKAIAMRLEW